MSALRLLTRPIRPLGLTATGFSRSLHSTPVRCVTRSQAPGQMPYGEQNTNREKKQYKSPYDVPLTEQAMEVAGDVKEKLSEVAGKAKRLTKQAVKRVKTTTHNLTSDKRTLFTSASNMAPRDGEHTFKEDAREIKEAAKDKLSDAWAATKSAARKAKDVIVDVAQVPVPPSGRLDLDSERGFTERAERGITNERREALSNSGSGGLASAAFTSADLESDSDPVRQAARSEVLSTTAGRRESWNAAPEDDSAAVRSAGSVGLEQDSVKKSFFDGPAEMPQGVGKRARDAEGKPMETGTRDS